MKTSVSIAALALAALASSAQAQAPGLRFARIFGDHAVVQRDQPVTLWGTAAPVQTVTVTINGQGTNATTTATADAAGKWRLNLPAMPAGGPYVVTATSGGATVTLNDIKVGDVYLCSGQSNMEFPARVATGAWSGVWGWGNDNIRFVNIEKDSEPAPLDDLKNPVQWKVSAADTTGDASAVCYYMARSLQARYGVPVGFINSSWGGTTIQSWIDAPTLHTLPAYATGVDAVAELAADPAKAMKNEDKRQDAWWEAHDKNAKAQLAWKAADFDDSKWSELTPTGSWKDAGIAEFKDFDGVAWFRTTVDLTEAQAAKANGLALGPIDSYDTTWVNGARVGGASFPWQWREYAVPAGVFKAGRNVIALRVLSGGQGGGLTGQPANRGIRTSDGQWIQLPPAWKYKVGSRLTGLSEPPAAWDVPTSLTTLYNGMIAPLGGYKLKLAAWYQGEANAGAAGDYAQLLDMMMNDWRKSLDEPDLPFVVAQLTSFGSVATQPGASGWAELRAAQGQAVRNDPHAGLAVTIDVGDRTDIHPTQKTVVGERLARAARTVAYGEAVTPGGPEAVSATRSGDDIVVAFKDTNGGLRTYSSNVAIAFEVCAGDACSYVPGVVSGDSVVLKGGNTAGATRVRYAWADAPYINLYSADDLPAAPFTLDVK
ncbi:MAG: glycoside hydrolase family 2 [Asticcacaulis sp.]|nr:glycoside hydrolase family 2 [Asticcacaulis sp.]